MGSSEAPGADVAETARALGQAIAHSDGLLLTGATTGVIHLVGKTARDAGALHIGISPGENKREHIETFQLPTDACYTIIYPGFGLKRQCRPRAVLRRGDFHRRFDRIVE